MRIRVRVAHLLILFAVLMALSGSLLAQPQFCNTCVSFVSPTVNAPGSATINFTATGTGLYYFATALQDPNGNFIGHQIDKTFAPTNSVNSSVSIPIPAFSFPGTWKIAYVFALDANGFVYLNTSDAVSAAFPTLGTLTVNSTSATTPPSLTSFTISPASIDTTAGSAIVTVGFTVTDSPSGVNSFQVFFTSPSGVVKQASALKTYTPAGTVTDSVTVNFPQYSAAGTWNAGVTASDLAGNTVTLGPGDLAAMNFPSTLAVANNTTAPTLSTLSFTPTSIDVTNAPATVTMSYSASDTVGVTTFQAVFTSPSGSFTRTATQNFSPPQTSVPNGSVTFTFPKGSEAGIWTLASVTLGDVPGNSLTLQTADLTAQSFPTQLTVMNNVPTITPSVPATGPSGWYTASLVPVNVSWTVTYPSGSGTSTGCGNSATSTNGTITLTCTATDSRGGVASSSVTLLIDTTTPVALPIFTPPRNTAGWNNSPVTVSWTGIDPFSGINPELSSDPVTVSTETAGTTVTGSVTNGAGTSGSGSTTVKLDMTPPTNVTGMASPTPNGAGWNNTNVTVTFTGADALSGIASCSVVTLTAEGAAQSASGACMDVAGNVSAPVTVGGINIDKTPPVTATNITPDPVQTNVATTLSATITDNLSGVASANYTLDGGSPIPISGTFGGTTVNVSVAIAAFSTTGLHDFCVQGTDVAGNVGIYNCVVLAVFDPSGGFSTGGGGTNSPAGADLANPSGSGPVTFGFNVKYLPHDTVPSGDVEFHYDAGNINFKSTGFDFLVVTSEPRAQIQGTGTINGTITCKFTIDAWSGSFLPGHVDAYGMTIYNCNSGTANRYNLATAPTTKGSIKIHQ